MGRQPDRLRLIEEEARAEVERRLVEKPQPPPEFDPLTASDAALARYGIPLKPRETDNPVLFELWQEALSPPMRIKAVRLNDLVFDLSYRLTGSETGFPNDTAAAGSRPSRFGGSRNWSGAYVVANKFRRFTSTGGTWTVPKPKAPQTGPGVLADGDYRASTWIGLDGNFRRSQSLPQAGTTQAVVVAGGAATAPSYSVWFQWWVRGQVLPPVTFDPVQYPVASGHKISCMLTVDKNSDSVHILMSNITMAWTAPIKYCGSNNAGLSVEGSTAEWVVERPTDLSPPYALYPLPDYGQVVFLKCSTTAAHDPPLGAAGNLEDARRVRMRLDVTGPPHRSAIISRAEKLGAHSLRTRYRSP